MKHRTWLLKALRLHFDEKLPRIEAGRRLGTRYNKWINGYYNAYRPHTNNGDLSPCLHEEKWKQVIPVS